MQVRLISRTVGVALEVEGRGPEDIAAYCARVSNPTAQANFGTSEKLLRYCMKHGHVSVFEMADFTFEVITSRAIAAQILRHRHFCFQEFSQRYSAVSSFEPIETRLQDTKNKQSSLQTDDEALKVWFTEGALELQNTTEGFYKQALEKGIAKEQARFVLPMNVQTTMYVKGSLRSWIHYLAQRLHPSTQKEHRDIAVAIQEILKVEAPGVMATLEDYNIYSNNPYG